MADAGTTPDVPVVIDGDVIVEFNEASSRQQINSGESVKTLFGKIRKFLTDLKAVAFSGAYSDLSGTPDLSQYASKAKYGDTTINVGRKAGTDVGARSTAEGYGNTANGNYSHAEGEFTTASGGYSHAEGIHTTASGEMSHAEGNETTASGANSHAEGSFTTASGNCSHAGGTGTKALHDNEVAYGRYNVSNADTVFSVGDGTSDSARHNAFEITTTGGKLHDKDIATTDIIPDLSAYAKTVDVPNIKVNSAVNADTVGGHSVGCDVPENAVFTDTVVDINTMVYTAVYNDVTWVESGLGKFYFSINLPNVNKILSINLGNWESLAADEIIQPCIYSNQQILIISNVAKSNGKMAFQITYI